MLRSGSKDNSRAYVHMNFFYGIKSRQKKLVDLCHLIILKISTSKILNNIICDTIHSHTLAVKKKWDNTFWTT